MAQGVLRVRIEGDARKLHDSLKGARTDLKQFGADATGASGKLKALGALVGGAAIVGAFRAAINETVAWGSEVKKLTRQTGLSAEQASALTLEAHHYGLEVDTLSRGLGIFQKHLVANDKQFQSLGISVKDSHGQLIPFQQILERTSAVFQKLPDGPQKTALALNLFGRNGKALLPFLSAGPKAMQEFSETAKKLGLSLSGDNLRAITQYQFAQRDLAASFHGLELQVSLQIIPVLTNFFHVAEDGVQILGKIPKPVLEAGAGFGALVLAINLATRAGTAASAAYASVTRGLQALGHSTEAAATASTAQAETEAAAAEGAVTAGASAKVLSAELAKAAASAEALATALGALATASGASVAGETAATVAIEAQGAAALQAAIELQALAKAELGAGAYGLRSRLAGGVSALQGIASASLGATLTLGGVVGGLLALSHAEGEAKKEAEGFANAFASAVGTGPEAISRIKDEIKALQGQAQTFTASNFLDSFVHLGGILGHTQKQEVEARIKALQDILKQLGITADATAAAGETAVGKISDAFGRTTQLNENLAGLVARGLPQKLAEQLKSMGQDGIDAAQELSTSSQADLNAFVDSWRSSLGEVGKAVRTFAGMTSDEFNTWATGLSQTFNFVSSGLNDLASNVSATTLAQNVASARDALTSAIESQTSASQQLADLQSRLSSGGQKTLSEVQQETRLRTALADLEARLHQKKSLTLSDLQAEQRARQALADFEARVAQKGKLSLSDLQEEKRLRQEVATASGKEADAKRALAQAEYDEAHPQALIIKNFENQLHAQEQYQVAFQTLIQRHLPEDFLKQLADMGQSGQGIVEALAGANATQFNKIKSDWIKAQEKAPGIAEQIRKAFTDQTPINMPVVPTLDHKLLAKNARAAKQDLLDQLGSVPLNVTAGAKFLADTVDITAKTVLFQAGKQLAEGGVFHKATAALIGEAGPEVVIPLSPSKKHRRDELLRESGLLKDIIGFAAGGMVIGPFNLPSVTGSHVYNDHSTTIIQNPIPERGSASLMAVHRRKQLNLRF